MQSGGQPWLWNPHHMLPEVQNRGISVPSPKKGLVSSKFFLEKVETICSSRHATFNDLRLPFFLLVEGQNHGNRWSQIARLSQCPKNNCWIDDHRQRWKWDEHNCTRWLRFYAKSPALRIDATNKDAWNKTLLLLPAALILNIKIVSCNICQEVLLKGLLQ